jgi:hypothetical protein
MGLGHADYRYRHEPILYDPVQVAMGKVAHF